MAALGFLTSLFDPQQPQPADPQAPMVVALDEVKRRRERAQKSYEKATDTSPVLSGWQGLARVAEGLNGAIDDYVARRDERAGRDAGQKAFLEALGGGATAPTSPASAGSDSAVGGAPAGPGDYFTRTRSAESSDDDAAKNPASSATGRYQFLTGTWSDLMKSRPDLGLTPDGRSDPQQQEKAMRAFTGQNADVLRTKGIDPTDRNLYMTHFLGAGASPNFINAVQQDPSVPATSLVRPEVAAANRGVFYNKDGTPRSVGDVYSRMTNRFGDGSTAVAALGGGAPKQPMPVQVAENEADVQRLEQQQGNPVIDGPARPATTQVARADVPAPGAAEAQGFAVPGQPATSGVTGLPLSGSKAIALMSSPTYEYLPAGQKAVVQAMAQRAITQSAKDPLEREKMMLEIAKMRREAAQGDKGVTMGSRLVDPRTGKVIVDFTEEDAAGPGKFGLSPVYGQDANGNTVMLQTNDKGQAVATKLPEGVKVSGGIEKLDGGTNWILLDKRTGNVIGTEKKDIAGAEREKVVGKQEGEAQMSMPQAVATAEQSLSTIDAVRKHPGRNAWGATGWTAGLPIIGNGAPGTEGRDFVNLVDQLKGQSFLEAFRSLKGGGAITEIEGAKATQAIARLDRAQSKKGFDEALNDLETIVRGGLASAKAKAGAGAAGGAAQPAPSVDTSKPGSFRYNPATGKMEVM